VSPFVLNIADLLGRSGASRSERITASVDWRLDASGLVPEPPLEADLVLQAVPSGILARGTVSFLTRNTCQRCLEVFDEKRTVAVAALFEREPEDEGYGIRSDTIDVEQLLIDETLLALPVFPVCDESCEGVVTSLESDLNTAPSDDDRESPFVVLKDFFGPEN
jgi:uncharacterized protein